MNLIQRLFGQFTARGRALTKISKGRACADNRDSEEALKHYGEVVSSSEAPRDVIAMALFNRALVYTTIGRESDATQDLNTVLNMPESIAEIKRSASDKLVRMRRKLEREESSSSGAPAQNS